MPCGGHRADIREKRWLGSAGGGTLQELHLRVTKGRQNGATEEEHLTTHAFDSRASEYFRRSRGHITQINNHRIPSLFPVYPTKIQDSARQSCVSSITRQIIGIRRIHGFETGNLKNPHEFDPFASQSNEFPDT